MMKLWWKFRSYWFRFRWWVSNHMPISCNKCSRVVLVKDTRATQTNWGQWVRVCRSCYLDLYWHEGEE